MSDFKLKVGDVCKLTEVLRSDSRCNDWRTGFYRVKFVHDLFRNGVRSYHFEKIKKDGTKIKSFCNGYNCLAWDKLIDEGKVTVLTVTNES